MIFSSQVTRRILELSRRSVAQQGLSNSVLQPTYYGTTLSRTARFSQKSHRYSSWRRSTVNIRCRRSSSIQNAQTNSKQRVALFSSRSTKGPPPQKDVIQELSKSISSKDHQPPLLIRSALVATTTAIGTPAFPVIGGVQLAMRWILPNHKEFRMAILGTTATTILGGLYVICKIAAKDAIPLVYSYSQLFVPFALVNGMIAGITYTALDVMVGTSVLANSYKTGMAIGAMVGMFGPWSGLYDTAFAWYFDLPEAEHFQVFSTLLWNNVFFFPITMTTGAMVGAILHPLLYYPIMGIPNVAWQTFSAPLLVGATGIMLYLYTTTDDYYDYSFTTTSDGGTALVDPNTYMTLSERDDMDLIPRFHPKDCQSLDWKPPRPLKDSNQPGDNTNQPDGKIFSDTFVTPGRGRQARQAIRAKAQTLPSGIVLDSRRKAWLSSLIGDGMLTEYIPTRVVPTEMEILQKSRILFQGDGIVTFLLFSADHDPVSPATSSQNRATATAHSDNSGDRDQTTLNDIQDHGNHNYGNIKELLMLFQQEHLNVKDPLEQKKMIQKMELASLGVAIWWKRKQRIQEYSRNAKPELQTTTTIHQEEQEKKLNAKKMSVAPDLKSLDEDSDDAGDAMSLTLLELKIRNLVPGVLLSRTEETAGLEGCSIEAQLDRWGWTSHENETLRKRWESGYGLFQRDAQLRTLAKGVVVAGTTMVLALGCSLLFGSSSSS